MSKDNHRRPQSPASRLSDKNSPLGDALDQAAPEFPKGEEAVSWTPNDQIAQPDTEKPDANGAGRITD